MSFQLNLLNCFKSPTPTNQVDLKNGDFPPKQVDPYKRKKERLLFDKVFIVGAHLWLNIFRFNVFERLCMKDETNKCAAILF